MLAAMLLECGFRPCSFWNSARLGQSATLPMPMWHSRPRLCGFSDSEFFPEPGIILRLADQSLPDRILPDIFDLCMQILKMPDHMIKGFILPDRPRSVQRFVDGMGRRTLDRSNNFLKTKRL